jgi:hypothetical protein
LRKNEPHAYHEGSVLKQKLLAPVMIVAAAVALCAARVPAPQTEAWNPEAFRSRSVAAVLPQGFVLPSADGDIKVSSLVAADLDADGDLDIVASEGAEGSLAILVWENDGAGRLTRREPTKQRSLDNVPSSPSFEQHQSDTPASVQPDNPTAPAAAVKVAAMPAARSFERTRAPDVSSAALEVLRSRSPPARS